ncbi:MAG: EAL domain-containing protein [Rhodocyclaceae bacterium]
MLDRKLEIESLLDEYAHAVELLDRMRNMDLQAAHPHVRHWSLPVDKTCADFFCSAQHPRLGWYGLIADVSGHGLVSAVFALHVPMLFREAVLLGMSLPAIYERIGRFLMHQHIGGHFVCGTLVRIIDREIEVLNGGMPDALLLAADGRLCEAFPSRQLPFGIGGEDEYANATLQHYRLARNEKAYLLMYSDGLMELGADGAVYGRDRVLANAEQGAEGIFDRLIDLVGQNAYHIHDDVSIALVPVPLPDASLDILSDAHHASTEPAHGQTMNVGAIMRIIEHLDHGLILTDSEQRILYVNPAFSSITGYSFEEAMGQTPRLLASGRHDVAFYRAMWQTLQTESNWFGEVWNRRKDGTLYLEWIDIQAIRDRDGQVSHYLATFTDIMRMREKDERLRFLALHDPLTGLANRILLEDRGAQAILRAERAERSLAVLFIDLDRFKSINDDYGHEVGDQVLREVARRLGGVLRADDTLARSGADEFVCLLPDIGRHEDAAHVAANLLATLDQPIDVAGHRFRVGASIGICAFPSDAGRFDDLIVRANQAMLSAKQSGGNLIRFFESGMAVAVSRQLEMEARLAAAIGAGGLELHYQPKLDLKSRRIVGAEALVRWRDPLQGLIPPGIFIPVAEKSDLIVRIGDWVLQEACAAIGRWEYAGRLTDTFHVAVNVSPLQFARCELVDNIDAALAAHGIAPNRLQIEVTESLLIRDAVGVADTLRGIAARGVSVALDDFGTAYSNLMSLARLPVDTFKLDQSFVRDVDSNRTHATIARAVWHLGDGLDKGIVAEGIETCEECSQLRALGYRVGQGYKFGKPMPEKDFLDHLDRWRPGSCGVCPDHFSNKNPNGDPQ